MYIYIYAHNQLTIWVLDEQRVPYIVTSKFNNFLESPYLCDPKDL